MLGHIASFATDNPAAFVGLLAIFILLALMAGYVVGVRVSDKKPVTEKKDPGYDPGKVQSIIIDYLNLGVIVYTQTGAIYFNETLKYLPGFLGREKKIPRDINAFLNAYGEKNRLKADYLVNIENEGGAGETDEDNVIRANYVTGRKIYEIKLLRRTIDGEKIDIVIVDDITQIKDDERRQKDLAANVSHELKTPLTVIRGSESFIKSLDPDNMPSYERTLAWGNRIIANAVRMQDIVQDFLILSMASSTVAMGMHTVEDIVDNAIHAIDDYPLRSRVNITLDLGDKKHLVFCNDKLIARVVTNLLTNSVKYISYSGKTAPDEVQVRIVEIDERTGVQVSDNGRGIPEKDIEHLFERFFRVDTSGSRDVGGSGIGLAIAKDISDMHSGNISVTSKLMNGSTFTFMLPDASEVFMSVFEDALAGVVSEKQYFRTAAAFIGAQAVEFIRSAGYSDVYEKADAFEKVSPKETVLYDKTLAELLSSLGRERYEELIEELLYVDDEGFDDEYGEDEYEEELDGGAEEPEEAVYEEPYEEEPEPGEPAEPVPSAIGPIDKEEARKILTQQILPRSLPVEDKGNIKETQVRDTNDTVRLYNSTESAVRKVLDEASALPVNPGKISDEEE